MCIIVGAVQKVAGTRIFVAPVVADRQLVVYSNEVELYPSAPPAAMILPFCNGAGSGVDILTTSPSDADLFDVLDTYFLRASAYKLAAAAGKFGTKSGGEKKKLEVMRAGSYRYSIAPTADDLLCADPDVFADMPADLQTLVDEYRTGEFGFIVCRLDASAKYAPFAYISDRCPAAIGGDALHASQRPLFVPTRHFHSPWWTRFALGRAVARMLGGSGTTAAVAADWDHEVFVLNGGGEAQRCDDAMAMRRPTETAHFHAVSPESPFYGMPTMRTPPRLTRQLAVFQCVRPALPPTTLASSDLVLYRINGTAPNADMRIIIPPAASPAGPLWPFWS